ncbi:MAG: hypothetical protein V7637_6026, partial [Mycobacteriales bacterium]
MTNGPTGLAQRWHAAAFHGGPAPEPPDPAGAGLDPRTRWLAAVYLGGLGRYGPAAALLLPGGRPADSRAASARASHLRQLCRHAEAEPLDRHALRTAGADPDARADALIGLVADAVGAGDLRLAQRRLTRATAELTATAARRDGGTTAGWRAAVRLDWVLTEVALFGDRPAVAVAAAAAALDRARRADAPRHAAKSLLMLGAATEVHHGASSAIPLLQAAAADAERLGLLPLVWPSRLLLARLLHSGDNSAASHERRAAESAICAIRWGLPAEETATLLARPEIRLLAGCTTVSAQVPPQGHPYGLQSARRSLE